MLRGCSRLGLASLLCFTLSVSPASADDAAPEPRDEHRLRWDPSWRPFEIVDYVSTAVVGGAYLYVELGVDNAEEPRWEGPILFDAFFSDVLVGDSADSRNLAGDISDPLWYVPMLLPHAEALLVPLLSDDWNWEITWELTLMNVQAAATSGLLMRAGHRFISRARPDTEPCLADEEYGDHCFGGVTASFPSGHLAGGMTGAGLTCVHHSHLPLYGGGAPDIATCATMVALGVGNGVLRIVSDRHYMTDVLVGAIVGFGSGFAMPALLHYGGIGSFGTDAPVARAAVVPYATDDELGVTMTGLF